MSLPVSFEMDPRQAAPAAAPAVLPLGDRDPPPMRERQVILADLVVLRQIGVVVVLAVPLGERSNFGMQRDGRLERQLERLAVHDRQRPGQAQRHRIRLGIRRQPELGTAPREHLALGLELNVNLEADDDVVVHTDP